MSREGKSVWFISILVIGCLFGCSSGGSSQSSNQGTTFSENNATASSDQYLIGMGIYDITGPAAEVGMTGFGRTDQLSAGISMRLWARTFIVADPQKPDRRVVFVNCDSMGMFQAVKQEIERRLAADPELSKYYNVGNVCLSATHTHSAITGFSHYLLYNIPTQGFIQDSFDAMVEGIFASIKRAHANLRPGKIYYAQGRLDNVGWNRSPKAYANNPEAERALYDGNTDKTMTLLKFVAFDAKGREVPIGMLNWYAIHPTSIGEDNHLISSDNKGHAEYMFEKDMGADYTAPQTFVAAFAQTNCGDVTGNIPFSAYRYDAAIVAQTMRAYGITDPVSEIARQGLPWPKAKSEADIEENIVLKMMSTLQYRKARELFDNATETLHGSVDYRHEYVDMRTLYVDSAGCTTCASGAGASATYGSPADNPTPYPLFSEGVTRDSVNAPDWNSTDLQNTILYYLARGVEGIVWPATLSQEYKECQGVKAVIGPTGLMSSNLYKQIPWQPQIVPIQVLKIGNLAIAGQPTEITTMAGSRVRSTLLEHLGRERIDHAVVAAYANTYASYQTTREEYDKQNYEGAFTLYGPHQLEGFQQEYAKLCDAMVNGQPIPRGAEPPDFTKYQTNWAVAMKYDEAPAGCHFGQVITDVAPSYHIGDKVQVMFWGANPRRNRHTMDSYLFVEQVLPGGNKIVRRDWDPDTKFMWEKDETHTSKVTMEWNTTHAAPGRYVIRYRGDAKAQDGTMQSFEGLSREFVLD